MDVLFGTAKFMLECHGFEYLAVHVPEISLYPHFQTLHES